MGDTEYASVSFWSEPDGSLGWKAAISNYASAACDNSEIEGRSEGYVHEHANHDHVNKRLNGIVHAPPHYRRDHNSEHHR